MTQTAIPTIQSLPIHFRQEIRRMLLDGCATPGPLCEATPVHTEEVRSECGRYVRTERTRRWTVPLEEGAVYVRRVVGDLLDRESVYAVVRDGALVQVTFDEACDVVDPANAQARADYRRQAWEEVTYRVTRSRGEGMTEGVYESWPGVYRYSVKAWPRQYESRSARPEEIEAYKAAQGVSPTP